MIIGAIFLMMLFSSCVTRKGATDYFLNKHPEQLAQLCADKFPVKEFYRPGIPVIIRDTIPGDSIPCPQPKLNLATGKMIPGKVKCPDNVNEKKIVVDTVYLEDQAKLQLLTNENLSLVKKYQSEFNKREDKEAELKALQKRHRNCFLTTIILAASQAILLYFLIRK
jgi:hypothetical protein